MKRLVKGSTIMKQLVLVLVASVLLPLLAGCDRLPVSKESQAVVDAYVAFRTAVSAGDVQKATALLASVRAKEMAGDPSAPDKLRFAAFLMPGTMTVMGVTFTDNKATLTLREGALVTLSGGSSAPALGPVPALSSTGVTGTVNLVKEGGAWKIDKESWNHDMGANPFQLAPARPFFREGEELPRLLKTIGGKGESQMRGSVAATPDGASLVTAGYGDYTVSRWSVADGREMASAKMEYRPTAVALTPDGGSAITLDAYGGVTFWPLTQEGFGTPVRTGSVGQSQDMAISRDGRYLALASFDKFVTIWDIAARKEIARATMPTPMRSVAFSPSGQLLAAGSAENTFTLWDLESGSGRTYTIPKVDAKSDVSGIAFSPDGKRLATTHMDSSITLWDVTTQKEVKNFFVSQSSSWSVRFSPDGAIFATATQGGNIHLWHAETGDKLGALQGQPSQPQGLAFSADGSLLFSAGEKGEVAVWGR
jgi:WD40 repeat protein